MDEKQLDEILKAYGQALSDLQESRAEESKKYSNMSTDELAESLEEDYKAVLKDANENGVTVGIMPNKMDEDDSDDSEEE